MSSFPISRLARQLVISEDHMISIVEHGVQVALRIVNTKKTAGLDDITGKVSTSCVL